MKGGRKRAKRMEEDQNMEAFRKKAEHRNAEKADVLLELYDLGGFCGRGLPLIDRRSLFPER